MGRIAPVASRESTDGWICAIGFNNAAGLRGARGSLTEGNSDDQVGEHDGADRGWEKVGCSVRRLAGGA